MNVEDLEGKLRSGRSINSLKIKELAPEIYKYRNSFGNSLLHLAILYDREDEVKMLDMIDITEKNKSGLDCIDLAKKLKRDKILKILKARK